MAPLRFLSLLHFPQFDPLHYRPDLVVESRCRSIAKVTQKHLDADHEYHEDNCNYWDTEDGAGEQETDYHRGG